MLNWGDLQGSWYLTMACYLATYAIHSTLFIALVWIFIQLKVFRFPYFKDYALRLALLGGVLSTIFQIFSGLNFFSTNILNLFAKTHETATVKFNLTNTSLTTTTNYLDWLIFVVVLIWMFTAIVLITKYLLQRKIFFHKLKDAIELKDGLAKQILLDLCTKVPIKPSIRLLESAHLDSPMAFDHSICLPQRAKYLNTNQLESMLAHELAHIKRRDDFWLQVYLCVENIFFFQVLNRFIRLKIQDNTEILCDNWAVKITGNQQALAQCLVEVASWLKQPAHYQLVSGMAVKKSALSLRVKNILNTESQDLNSARFLGAILLISLIFSSLSFFSPQIYADFSFNSTTIVPEKKVDFENAKKSQLIDNQINESLDSKTEPSENLNKEEKTFTKFETKKNEQSADNQPIAKKEQTKFEVNTLESKDLEKINSLQNNGLSQQKPVFDPREAKSNLENSLSTKDKPTTIDKKSMVKSKKYSKNGKVP
jgi:beta-lactamase regulating signal transducer with metallopeptidase domain